MMIFDKKEQVTMFEEARFKKSAFGTGQFVGHGHFTYSTKVKQAGKVQSTMFQDREVLLCVNPGSIDSVYCKVAVGGAMTRKELVELAAYFKIAGISKMKKEDIVVNTPYPRYFETPRKLGFLSSASWRIYNILVTVVF